MRYVCIWVNLLIHLSAIVSIDHAENHNTTKNHSQSITPNKNVLLISFDGFRWDYFNMVNTPVLNSFKTLGVHAKYVKNVIPTETFPNHVTLATGLYPESHGIISNDIYDPIFKSEFNMSVTDPKWWWNSEIEPIWYTNEKQGGRSGVCYWPGYNIDGYRPIFYPDKQGKYAIPYHEVKNLMPYKERVDNVMKWLNKDKPPNFLMLYFGQLDEVAHMHGFGSTESLEEVLKLDNITGYLLDQLSEHNLLDKWNIIITGDHGMTNLSLSRVINITDYVNSSDCKVAGDGAIFFIWPNKGKKTEEVFKKLQHAHPNMKVYLKKDIPRNFHYQKNRRISPIVLMLDEGWMLNTAHHPFNQMHFYQGGHGYLNTLPSMWPLFLARGPAFKKGYLSAPFESVDIYNLMCKILGINARPNNGSLRAIRPLLSETESEAVSPGINPVLVGVMVSSLFFVLGILIFIVAMCVSHKKKRRSRSRAWNTSVVMSELEQTNKLLSSDDDNDDDRL